MQVRARKTVKAYYGFGDASGARFGATIMIDAVEFEYGQWSKEITESSSSNWRELKNLVVFITRAVHRHDLAGSELFIFTDNSTAEAAFWKGSSKSRRLFDLVLELRKLERDAGIQLHIIHVSGTRMKKQGTDGLLRGEYGEGVMSGLKMLDYIPLDLNVIERSKEMSNWVTQFSTQLGGKILTPEGWFDEGHTRGTFVWTPPPAAGEVVVEQLGFARLKRPECMHVILIPRLMTGRWRRLMTRGSDFYCRLDGDDIWDLKIHFEPVLMFVCLPVITHNPKLDLRERLLGKMRRHMLEEGLQSVPEVQQRNILCKLLIQARELLTL